MNTILVLLGANICILLISLLLKMSVTDIYSFLAFNSSLVLFIGFANLAELFRANFNKNKGDKTDDTNRTSINS